MACDKVDSVTLSLSGRVCVIVAKDSPAPPPPPPPATHFLLVWRHAGTPFLLYQMFIYWPWRTVDSTVVMTWWLIGLIAATTSVADLDPVNFNLIIHANCKNFNLHTVISFDTESQLTCRIQNCNSDPLPVYLRGFSGVLVQGARQGPGYRPQRRWRRPSASAWSSQRCSRTGGSASGTGS